MRILLASAYAYPKTGGVENSLIFVGRSLIAAGHEVKILCLQSSSEEPLRSVHEGVEICRVAYAGAKWPHKRYRVMIDAAKEGFRMLHEEFSPDAVWSRSVPIALGILESGYSGPLIQIYATNAAMSSRGTYLNTKGLPISRRVMLACLFPFDYLSARRGEQALFGRSLAVTFSKNMRTQLMAGFRGSQRPIEVIRPGVDHDRFSIETSTSQIAKIREAHGIGADEKTVLYVGRMASQKNIPILMDAVRKAHTKPKLVLVGDGPESAVLQSYAEYIGIADRVIFAGKQTQLLPTYYAMSDVFVLPTTLESFGQVFLESLACGTPAIGFGSNARKVRTATEEIIQDGVNGHVVSEISPEALAVAIDRILKLPEPEYQAFSKRARETVLSDFSWQHFVENVIQYQNDSCT